jgi:hypothetical protein
VVSGVEYDPRVGYGEHGEWCGVWSKGGHLLTWCLVQRIVQGWAMVNMVNGVEYGPRVGYGEHGEWCRVWSKGGLW